MCGIAGVFSYASEAKVDEAILRRMRDSMAHRGPDGVGEWFSNNRHVGLAHRRLSIVDLSAEAAQPMANEDGRVIVTFNGEIYNHRPLRAELTKAAHRFRSDHSDTEVLVHGYEQWGIDGLLDRIEGDYAFALWDDKAQILHLARDRIGVKPLYFALEAGAVIFGSEIKALVAHPDVSRDIEPVAMYHYLSFLTAPAPLTMFKGIYKIPSGWRVSVSRNGRFDARQYWDPCPGKGIQKSEIAGFSAAQRESFYVRGIRERLDASVQKRMMSDVPIGVFLSGGIDSSTNVALMSRYTDQPLNTFSVGFKDHTELNELQYAQLVANKFNTRHREILIDAGDMMGYIDQLVHQQDEPLADWVCIPLHFVSKLARESGVTVVQVGEGADEQFSGYDYHRKFLRVHRLFWSPFNRFMPDFGRPVISKLASLAGGIWPRFSVHADFIDRAARERELFWSGATVLWDFVKHQGVHPSSIAPAANHPEMVSTGLLPKGFLQPDSFNVVKSYFEQLDREHPGQDQLTRMIYSEFRLRLPELLLMRVDKITMSCSLEGRVPFLDHALVDFTMDIPMADKVRQGESKYLLKRAVSGWIPDEIIHRKKMGFGAPMAQWMRGGFGDQAREKTLSSKLMNRGWFNTEFIQKMWDEHRSARRDNSIFLWALFNLTTWYDYWIDGGAEA
jgi:asparagine synthase (glutamine-hydrolysing)